MKAMVCSPDGETGFNIVGGVFQGDTSVSYIFIICWDNVIWTLVDQLRYSYQTEMIFNLFDP